MPPRQIGRLQAVTVEHRLRTQAILRKGVGWGGGGIYLKADPSSVRRRRGVCLCGGCMGGGVMEKGHILCMPLLRDGRRVDIDPHVLVTGAVREAHTVQI